jgi:sulfur carrier protein
MKASTRATHPPGAFSFGARRMKIQLNGKEHDLAGAASVAELLQQIKIPPTGTAVVINGAVVAGSQHAAHTLSEGDCVDIVRAIGGG